MRSCLFLYYSPGKPKGELYRSQGGDQCSDHPGDGKRPLYPRAGVAAFEEEFAAYIGVRFGIGVSSGTDALHLALRACGIGGRG